jgi:hypothetical protein
VAPPLTPRWHALAPRLPAAALLALGLATLIKALKLPFGSIGAPDSGFYPSVVCVALVAFAALSLAIAEAPPSGDADVMPEPHAAVRVWTVIAALALYGLALAHVGFIACTAALLVLLLRLGRVAWPVSLALAAVSTLVCYGLFTRLGVPLPPGLLSF